MKQKPPPRGGARRLIRALLPGEIRERARRVVLNDAGLGYDVFGAKRGGVAFGQAIMHPLYHRWFRVDSHDAHNIPAKGAALLAANHSGTIPLDAMMLWFDVLQNTEPPRLARMVLDHFVPSLPFVGLLFTRAGAVGGSRGNLSYLLEHDELVGVFPEGVPGVGKPFAERYQLQAWREGHVEFAIRHQCPIIPVGVVGAEEQLPQVARLPAPRWSSIPYFPVAPPFPLPVHYHIYYGEPVNVHERHAPDAANNPDVLLEEAAVVKRAVRALLDRGLAERKGVFL